MRVLRRSATAAAVLVALLAAGCGSPSPSHDTPSPSVAAPAPTGPGVAPASPASPGVVPANAPPDHVVVVVFENKAYDQIAGSARAPYLNQLAAGGVQFERYTAVAHPSEPNYLALFSGSTH